MAYKLPMNDDGTVRLGDVADELYFSEATDMGIEYCTEILTALAAHERARGAEKEREACIDAIPDGFDGPFEPEEKNVAFRAGLDSAEAAIRARGANEVKP